MGVRSRFAELLAQVPAAARAVESDGGVWHTWQQFQTEAHDLDALLTPLGLGDGARVGVVIENRPEHVGALVALLASGRCVVTLSPLQPPERLAADIRRSKVPVVVAAPDVLARTGVREAVEPTGVAVALAPDGALTCLGGEVRGMGEGSTHNPGTVIEMLTSGTTGPPKRIHLSDDQFDKGVGSMVALPKDGLLRGGVTIVVAPLVHIGGFWGALAPLYAGRRLCLLTRFEVDKWADAIERHRPPAASIVPAAVRAVLEADVPAERLSSLQVITCGTAYCPPELADEFFRTYGVRVLMTYGATEFAGAIAAWTKSLHEKWWTAKAGSAGRATPGVELRIVGPDGGPVPAGEPGTLEVRSAQSPMGADAWVRTSDLARIDEDGFLFVLGRTDDAIVRGGFKVQPATVAKALERHPAVREAAVAPFPDARLGHVPVAGVQVDPGMPRPDSAELAALCREVLTPYEVPVHVSVFDELPRTPSAKVSRVDLVALIEQDMSEARAAEAGGPRDRADRV